MPIPAGLPDLLSAATVLPTEQAFAALKRAEIGISPMVPLLALLARREEIVPRLLVELGRSHEEMLARDPPEDDRRHANWLPMASVLLLGLIEEKQAYTLLVRFLAQDTHVAAELLGDVVTEDLPAILARTYDGSERSTLEALIEATDGEPTVREACLRGLIGMVRIGKVDRAEAEAYLARILDSLRNDANIEFADTFVLAAALLQAPTLRPAIDAWFGADLIAEDFVSPEDIDAVYAKPPAAVDEDVLAVSHFDNLADYIASFAWFTETDPDVFDADDWNPSQAGDDDGEWREPGTTFVRETPKVGRNDPCPCGSGKKYKKCCLS